MLGLPSHIIILYCLWPFSQEGLFICTEKSKQPRVEVLAEMGFELD